MGSSRDGRFRQRSKSCDSGFNKLSSYDEGALSRAIWGNRFNALTRIWPFLVDEPEEVISLKKQLQHLEKNFRKEQEEKYENFRKEEEEKYENSRKEEEEKYENLRKEQEEKYENLRKEQEEKYENLRKEQEEKYENFRKEQEEKCENLQSQVADFQIRVEARELVKNFKAGSYSQIDKLLMDKARERLFEEFPKEPRVLKDLERLLGPTWRCTQKFWDLLILAYKFPKDASWKNFEELMKLTYSRFPKEFTWKSFEDLMELVHPKSVFRAEYRMLKEKLSNEDLYNLMKLERGVFHDAFFRTKFEDLMGKAYHLFHEVFPQEYFTDRYTVMVASLVNRYSILKDEKLFDISERKLDCLRDVATKFQWSNKNKRWTDKGFGKQFFLLCKNVAESNIIFHPELKGPRGDEFVKRASEGLFKIDGMDVGPVAIELYYRGRLS